LSAKISAHLTGNRGAVSKRVEWQVPKGSNGWVIQRIHKIVMVDASADEMAQICKAGGNVLAGWNGWSRRTKNTPLEFYEAWAVLDGEVYNGRISDPKATKPGVDSWSTADEARGTRGRIAIYGRVTFMAGYQLDDSWNANVKEAHGLPSHSVNPPPKGLEGATWQSRSLEFSWNEHMAPNLPPGAFGEPKDDFFNPQLGPTKIVEDSP
jgi:hypothetical protein